MAGLVTLELDDVDKEVDKQVPPDPGTTGNIDLHCLSLP